MQIVRALARLVALGVIVCDAALEFGCLAIHGRRNLTLPERAAWVHRYSRKLLNRWRVLLLRTGTMPSRGLIVSNHLSYLDVLSFSALAPCVFVAKSEVRRWPFFGVLAAMGGTIFVDRTSARDAGRANCEIEACLQQGIAVVLFPEGTSSNGSTVLPFRSPLFESAIRSGARVTPARVSYELEHGSVEHDICYWGEMTFGPHLLKLLSRKGIVGWVMFGDNLGNFENRKDAARVARESVVCLARPELPRQMLR